VGVLGYLDRRDRRTIVTTGGTPNADTVALTYREALRTGLREALATDDRVFLMGEDVGAYGGCFAVSLGLLEEFGPTRVRDTPLSESAFVGAGIGAALGGMRPIVEVMTVNFALLALDQIVNNAATLLHMSGGQFNVPLVIRTTTGAGRQLAAQHSHSLEAWFAHIPGLRVVAPATVADARAMLLAALDDPDPVLVFEHGALFGIRDELPAAIEPVDLDRAATRRSGGDATIVTHGASLHVSLEAATQLAREGIEVEVVDLRTLRPLDTDTILASVARTGRLVVVEDGWRSGGIGAEVAARVAEEAFWDLDAPIERVAAAEVPIPYAHHLEEAALVGIADVLGAIRRVLG
jgi:pyruvate dehydrogenase E1 component beta subunit